MGLALDEPKENDESYDNSELTFVVENELMKTCGGIKIDYHEDGYKSGFAISSSIPIDGGGGGCGSSCSSGGCG